MQAFLRHETAARARRAEEHRLAEESKLAEKHAEKQKRESAIEAKKA